MFRRLSARVVVASLMQLGLLAGFYSDPASRVVPARIYVALLAAASGLLLVLAYQAFQRQRPIPAIIAALLAFPGLLLVVVVLAVWAKAL